MNQDHNLSSNNLLNETYTQLGYRDGSLLNAVYFPETGTKEEEEWIDKGEWLSTARRIGAEKIFFVNDDPVIVFHNFHNVPTDNELLNTFRKAWCMARPHCLFLAFPGELRVYSLSRKPARNLDEWRKIEPIEVASSISKTHSSACDSLSPIGFG